MVKQCVCASLVLAALAVSAVSPARARAKSAPPQAAWVFAIHHDLNGDPRGQVSLRVGGKDYVVSPRAAADYSVLRRTEYADRHIPARALIACSGWWAGGGEVLYVVQRRKRLFVFQRDVDEESSDPPFHIIKSIAAPR